MLSIVTATPEAWTGLDAARFDIVHTPRIFDQAALRRVKGDYLYFHPPHTHTDPRLLQLLTEQNHDVAAAGHQVLWRGHVISQNIPDTAFQADQTAGAALFFLRHHLFSSVGNQIFRRAVFERAMRTALDDEIPWPAWERLCMALVMEKGAAILVRGQPLCRIESTPIPPPPSEESALKRFHAELQVYETLCRMADGCEETVWLSQQLFLRQLGLCLSGLPPGASKTIGPAAAAILEHPVVRELDSRYHFLEFCLAVDGVKRER